MSNKSSVSFTSGALARRRTSCDAVLETVLTRGFPGSSTDTFLERAFVGSSPDAFALFKSKDDDEFERATTLISGVFVCGDAEAMDEDDDDMLVLFAAFFDRPPRLNRFFTLGIELELYELDFDDAPDDADGKDDFKLEADELTKGSGLNLSKISTHFDSNCEFFI